ncbi:hypothetical protein LPJ81_003376 [Coemansia sp. IMI 209127]|nr:hypothetical protein LPJ81_003376 [Coemansia sp. IMI 209127]
MSSSAQGRRRTLGGQSPACHRVPPEILRQIFISLAQNQSTLYQCVLTCRQWCRVVIPIMWRRPQFSRLIDVKRFAATLVASSSLSTTPGFPYTNLVESLCFSKLAEQDRNNPYLATLLDTIINCLVVVVATTPPPLAHTLLPTLHCSSHSYCAAAQAAGQSGGVVRRAKKCPLSSGTIKRSRSVLFRNGIDPGMRPYSTTDLPLGPDSASGGAENESLYGGGMKPSAVASDMSLPRNSYSLHSPEISPLSATALPDGLVTLSSAVSSVASINGCSYQQAEEREQTTFSDRDNGRMRTTYASSLRQLDLRFCKGVRNYSLQRLAPRLSTLSILNLAGGQRADITIAKLSQHMYNLRRVSFAWTSNLTDFGVSELVQRCKGIQALDLTYCTQIEDTSLFAIAHHLKDLRALSVAYCASVSDIGVREVAARCRSIRVLNVAKCFRVSERTRMDMERQKIVTICDPFASFSINEDPHVASRASTLS